MPTYEYKCDRCNKITEHHSDTFLSQEEDGFNGSGCACGGRLYRILSMFRWHFGGIVRRTDIEFNSITMDQSIRRLHGK